MTLLTIHPLHGRSSVLTLLAILATLALALGSPATGALAAGNPPVATNGTLTTNEDIVYSGALSASDTEGDALTYSLVTNGSQGVVTITNASSGAFTYTPNANVTGSDSFTFKVNDGTTDSNTATVNVTITAVDDPPALNVSDTASYSENGAAVVVAPNLTISDLDGGTISGAQVVIIAHFEASQDYLGIDGQSGTSGTVSGLTWSYSSSTGVLQLIGSATAATYQAALRQVTYRSASDNPATAARTILFGGNLTGVFYYSGNGHYYEYINTSITWNAAKTAAAARTYGGLQGYLATLTSAGENTFVTSLGTNNRWIGASDATVEGEWRWETGPETGTQFWQGAASGSVVGGQYSNWNSGEPNNVGNEDYGTLPSHGAWNDLPASSNAGYIVEYGGMAGDPVVVPAGTVTVNVTAENDAPEVADTALSIDEDIAYSGALSASDAEGDPLTYSLVSNGGQGVVTITNASSGAFTYTPNANVSGNDSFTFKVSDGALESSTATINVTITAVDDPPTLSSQGLTLEPGATATIGASLLAASDLESGSAAITYTLTVTPTAGTLTLNSASLAPGSSFTQAQIDAGQLAYTHTGAASGDSFSFTVAGSNDQQVTRRISRHSNGSQSNHASYTPVFSADGRYVAFASYASNLVDGDSNGQYDVFVRDMQTGTTTRVSRHSDGTQGNDISNNPAISADGRYVAFHSNASNLVDGDSNGQYDVFVRDMQTGTTTRVSRHSDGSQGNNSSFFPAISADGRYVAFASIASNLVDGDSNTANDIFVHDTQTGTTTRVSRHSDGSQGNNTSAHAAFSADGRYVAFRSDASNLVDGDSNNMTDIFIHDMQTGTTTRVSRHSDGSQSNESSYAPALSADGRYVAFFSFASNLVDGDSNTANDVFVHDMQTGTTTRVSHHTSGAQGNNGSFFPGISADGRYVVFTSAASNLVDDDSNSTNDVFMHDTQTGRTIAVTRHTNGTLSDGYSSDAAISADGRSVAFYSNGSNLVAGDSNNTNDIFVWGAGRLAVTSGSFAITIALPNHAPVLADTGAGPELTAIDEDAATNAGNLVSSLIATGVSITDADAGAVQGIAITAAETTGGVWQFSLDSGTNWTPIPAVANPTALLLAADSSTRLRFVPNADFNGTSSVTFQAWDRTSGLNGATADTTLNGGNSAFSIATDRATIVVAALNDAPTLNVIANLSVPTNAALQTVSLSGISAGPASESGQTLTVMAISSNPALIPHPIVSYSSPSTAATLSFTPVANASGTATITVQVIDSGRGDAPHANTITRTFVVSVGGDFEVYLPLVIQPSIDVSGR